MPKNAPSAAGLDHAVAEHQDPVARLELRPRDRVVSVAEAERDAGVGVELTQRLAIADEQRRGVNR